MADVDLYGGRDRQNGVLRGKVVGNTVEKIDVAKKGGAATKKPWVVLCDSGLSCFYAKFGFNSSTRSSFAASRKSLRR